MGTLGHVLEACGLATVVLASVRGQIERVAPPRALYCEFPLGRPVGIPGDPAFQRRVLMKAFSLLESPTRILADYPEVIRDTSDEVLSCAIPARFDPSVPAAVDEARSLRKAYDRALDTNGRTLVGRVITADDVPKTVAKFVRIVAGEAWNDVDLCGDSPEIVEIAMDVRAYYEEAAIGLAAGAPAPRAAENWFYQETEAGRLLLEVRCKLRETGLPYTTWHSVAPGTQRRKRTDPE